jgi:hypothetical protein
MSPVKTSFPCPVCARPGQLSLASTPVRWQCPGCDHVVELAGPVDPALPCCVLCGNRELYRKKNFPHALGMGILVTAFLASTLTYWLYNKVLTWVILFGSAIFDGLLYLWVGDVSVCYRCQAHYYGVSPDAEHRAFELTTHERYRQEQIRLRGFPDDKVTR